MDANVHNPERTQCQTMHSEGLSGHFAVIGFGCHMGGTVNLFFNSPEDLREHAAAMMLLADSLEEKQCTISA